MLTVTILVLSSIVILGCGKGHDDDHEEHGKAQAFTEPQSYTEAVSVIHHQLEKIEKLIDTRQLGKVHAQAAVIRDVANDLAKLAAKKDSDVPSAAIREINLTAKDLAAKFGPIDEAGDSGNLAGTRKVRDEMVALFETLEKYAEPDHEDH